MRSPARPVAAFVALLLLAQSATAAAPPAFVSLHASARIDSLAEIASRQETAPDAEAQALAPPTWIEAQSIRELDPNLLEPGSPAVRPLDDVMEDLKARHLPKSSPPPADADPEALSLYAAGRLKAADGKFSASISDLEAAAKIAPDSPEIWRALGDVQLAASRPQAAIKSYQKAVALGLDEAHVHLLLGRDARRKREIDAAQGSLVRARLAPDYRNSTDLGVVIDIELADILLETNYLAAARAILVKTLDAPFQALSVSRFRNDLTEVYRRRADLWVRAGDISFRLGEPAEAISCYARAAEIPSIDPTQIVLREVWAHLRTGHSAVATRRLLESIESAEGRIDDRQLAAISTLSSLTAIGPALTAELTTQAASNTLTPTIGARLARAVAAASKPAESRVILRKLATTDPSDGSIVVTLLSTYGPDEAAAGTEIIELCRTSPTQIPVIAGAALAYGRGLDQLVDVLRARPEPTSKALLAYLLAALGQPKEALGIVRSLPVGSVESRMALAQIGTLAGDSQAVRDAATGLEETDGRSMLLNAQLLSEAGEAKAAAAAADRAAATELTTGEFVQAAGFLAAGGEAEKAEAALRRALALDRFDERIYEALLNLYTETGPLSSERKLTETARGLRQNLPSSRVIRSLQAQESIAKSLFAQAESQLLGLIDPHFEPPQLLDLLISLWSTVPDQAIASRGEEWLRKRLTDRPQSTLLIGGLARVLHARGQSQEAETLLADRLKAWPIPELARLREMVLRDGLHRPEEADALTLKRLNDAPPTPSIAFEWIELLSRQGDFAGAAAKAATLLPKDRPLPASDVERLAQVLGGLNAEAVVAAGPEACLSVGDLFDRVVTGGTQLSPKLHLTRVEILSRGGAPASRVVNAILEFAKVQPELEISALGQSFAWMRQRSASDALALVLEHCNAKPDERVVRFLLAQTGDLGSAADAQRVVKELKPLNLFRAVLTQIDPVAAAAATDDNMLRADLAYQLALQFATRDLKAETQGLYRLAMELHPRHGWAANNLGYDILESGGDLDEAERLIELAYDVLPREASILDSLAWLRYQRGQLEDEPAADGKPERRGALWLIDRAVQLNPAASAEVMDHAGDIFWASGNEARAVDFWNRAAVSGEVTARDLRARGLTSSFVSRLETLAKNAREKLDAARNGRDPAIAVPASKK